MTEITQPPKTNRYLCAVPAVAAAATAIRMIP
jgi:hypothetical protein